MFRELLLRYRQTLVLTLVLALPVGSMYWHGKERKDTSLVEKFLLVLTAPGQRLTYGVVQGVRDMARSYVLLVDTEARNQELEQQNRILLGAALEKRTLEDELQRVKQLCEFKSQRDDLQTVPARVVGRDVSQFFQVMRLQLDVQGNSAVHEGQAVITHDGVVGRIDKIAGSYADVMLVTDARSQVHATIAGKGVIGSVQGHGKKNEFTVQFVYLDRADHTVAVQAADAVLTTGHDHVFPAGLEVGHVAEGKALQTGPYQEFQMVPAVTFATLEEVLIVTGQGGSAPLPAEPPPTTKGKKAVDPANTPDSPP